MPRLKQTDRQLQERIAGRLRQARAQKGWTQEQLAEALDVATETVSRYELGRLPPSLAMLYRMAKVLRVDIESLVGKGPAGLAGAEAELIEEWRLLDAEEKSILLRLVRRFSRGRARRTAATKPPALHERPVHR